MIDVKEKAKEAAEAAKRFNEKPPFWFYVVAFVVIVIAAQLIRFN